jgi:hypothetical protein
LQLIDFRDRGLTWRGKGKLRLGLVRAVLRLCSAPEKLAVRVGLLAPSISKQAALAASAIFVINIAAAATTMREAQ